MKKKILMVDDDPDILKTTKYALELEEFLVDTAENGEEGLRKIKESKPDLLLLDLKLPDKSGYKIAKEIKALDAYKDIPIIVLSGMTDEASKYIAARGGAVQFLEKPLDLEKLKFHIDDILCK